VPGILGLALLGRMPGSQAGWLTCPPQVVMLAAEGRRRPQSGAYRFSLRRPQCRLASGDGSESCPQLMTVAKSCVDAGEAQSYNRVG